MIDSEVNGEVHCLFVHFGGNQTVDVEVDGRVHCVSVIFGEFGDRRGG